MKAIVNGRLILPDERGDFFIADGKALAFDEKIRAIGDTAGAAEIIDAGGNFVAPGFINIHIHGCAGFDAMDAPPALEKIAAFLPTTGVTAFLPTTMTMPLDEIRSALGNIRDAQKNTGGARILGANVEGPFISAKFHGAQDKKNIRRADLNLFGEFLDVMKIITAAPEEIDFGFIDACRANGIIVAIGHSAADFDTAKAAIARGANHITHLFNAQTGLHHRKPGIVGAALDTHATVELIADNVHVHPAAQRIVWKVKPRGEIILITDSLRACGLGDCETELGGQKVFVRDGVARLEDGNIAASVAPMNAVVRNFMENTGAGIAEVTELATKNPARRLGIYGETGSLEVGKAADVIIFDGGINIERAVIGGEILR